MTAPDDRRRFLLTLCFAVWAMAYGYSFVTFALTESDGDGFTKGLNRVSQFLGWQGVAGIMAFAVFGVSRAWPRGTSVRWLGAMPVVLAGLLVLAILATIGWARFAG